jgi:hypothetical protein
MIHLDSKLKSSAVFSRDRVFRYELIRQWDKSKPMLHISGLNPSTADEIKNDPTVRREIGFAMDMGFGGLRKTNAFAFRATDPEIMKSKKDPIGPENDRYILKAARSCGMSIAAWGIHGNHRDRDRHLLMLPIDWYCFGITKDGHPRHPLYLPKTARPVKLTARHTL